MKKIGLLNFIFFASSAFLIVETALASRGATKTVTPKLRLQKTLLEGDYDTNGKTDAVALFAATETESQGEIRFITNHVPGPNAMGELLTKTGSPWDEFHLSAKALWSREGTVLFRITQDFGDHRSESLIFFSAGKSREAARYSHPNYDDNSKLKVSNGGVVTFEGEMGGSATIEGQEFDFIKAEKSLKCPEKKLVGFQATFEPATKRFAPAKTICYDTPRAL